MNVVKKRCLGALLAFACAACCFAGVASFTTVAAAKSAEYAADAEVCELNENGTMSVSYAQVVA